MLNPVKFLRYLVFAVFIICNAIIASAAVWNLSIIISGDLAKEISIYLIFLGASGLVVIFTVIFFDLYGKDVFIGRVWFELLWVILFFIMELAGAVAITSPSNAGICNSNISVSPCASTQVLQAFTWICAILLPTYFTLLFVSAILKYKEDPTIWRCSVRKYLWHHTLKSVPPPLPRFRPQVPIIAAPRPRRIIALPEPALSYRSGLGLDYEIEHYQPAALGATDLGPATNDPISPLPSPLAVSPTQIPPSQPSQRPLPAFTPFYPAHVQTAINQGLKRASTARLSPVRRLPHALSPSPPPLGDWPRRDATSQPARGKQKIATQKPPLAPTPYSFTMATAAQQSQPLVTPSTRPRPSGPRRRSNSGENHRPPNIDLPNFI